MIWNYLTVGFRKLRQNAFYSLLNILGLAVGVVVGCKKLCDFGIL